RRRAAQGPGTPTEVPGHPGAAGRAGPGTGRPGRVLPRRAGGADRGPGAAGALRRGGDGEGRGGQVEPGEQPTPGGGGARLPGRDRGERQTADRGRGDDAEPVARLTPGGQRIVIGSSTNRGRSRSGWSGTIHGASGRSASGSARHRRQTRSIPTG